MVSGKINSFSPPLGPDPIHLISLAIFIKLVDNNFNALLVFRTALWFDMTAYLLGAVRKGNFVSDATCEATIFPNFGLVFTPVPTAVPPAAK